MNALRTSTRVQRSRTSVGPIRSFLHRAACIFLHPSSFILHPSVFATIALSALPGCDMLDMYDERRYEPLEASALFEDGASARPLVPGTVARGQLRDNEPFYVGKQDGKFVEELPLELTSEVLARGQERFNI
jgi:hypothetical protein